jgi:segregation and condensation protein B
MAKKKKKKEEAPEQTDEAKDDASETDESEHVESLSREDTTNAVYAMLFASDRSLSIGRIAEALGDIDRDIVANIIDELMEQINRSEVPYELREIAGGYQLTTDSKFAPYIRRLFQIKKSGKLSKAVLETLAIIAYRQPVTRPDVESIRGVSVSHAFNILQEKQLVKAVGVADVPGRPRLYRTTDEFLDHFGIKNLKDLPSIEELREIG